MGNTMESVMKHASILKRFHCTYSRWLVIAYSTDLIWQNWTIIVMLRDVLAVSTGFSTIGNKPTRENGEIRYF